MSNILSINIGEKDCNFAVFSPIQEIIYQNDLQIVEFEKPEYLFEAIKADLLVHGQKYGLIGLSAASINHNSRSINRSYNPKSDEIILVEEICEKVFQLETTAVSDSHAAVLAEKRQGGGAELSNFAVVTLDQHVGCGIYLNNELYFGPNGNSGEIGQLIIYRDGRENKHGFHGTLESYVGAEGIIATAKQKLEFSSGGSMLQTLPPSEISPSDIFKYARKEDPIALAVADSVADDLAIGLSHLINVLNIEVIFLTGSVAKSGNILRKKVEKALKYYVNPDLHGNIQLKISPLVEQNSALLGGSIAASELETENYI